jgi:GNAT superfamily N-acetyltransferase
MSNSYDIMDITEANIVDAPEILALQKVAYLSEAAIYRDDTLPPLTQNAIQIRDEFGQWQFLKAIANDRIVGSVRAQADGDTCFIGRLIVHPDFQRRGIGTALMQAVEARYPQVRRFELFTGYRSTSNLRFYQRRGYTIFKEKDSDAGPTLLFLQKMVQPVPM